MSTVDPSAPGWYPDPTGRHERRYWSGIRWSRHVDNGGERGDDPIDPDSGERPAVRPLDPPASPPPAVPEPPQLDVEHFQPSYDRFQPALPPPPPRRSWIAGAAAAVVAVIGIGTFLATQGGDSDGTGDGQDAGEETDENDDPLMDHMIEFSHRATGETITEAQAQCMARNALGQVTRERMLEAGVLETANPLTVLTKEEVIRVIPAVYDCLDNDELIAAMASAFSPNRFGGLDREVAPCIMRGWIEGWGRERAVEVFANIAMPEWETDLGTFLTPEESQIMGNVVGTCVAANEAGATTTTTTAG